MLMNMHPLESVLPKSIFLVFRFQGVGLNPCVYFQQKMFVSVVRE